MNKITLNSVNSDCQKICRHLAECKVVVTSEQITFVLTDTPEELGEVFLRTSSGNSALILSRTVNMGIMRIMIAIAGLLKFKFKFL